MSYDFVPGVEEFIADLHRNGVKMAVVTSSNDKKMEAVYRAKPEIKSMFDRILTAEMFTASKPAPDCFLLGMEVFDTTPETTYVFEDSFNGLKPEWLPVLQLLVWLPLIHGKKLLRCVTMFWMISRDSLTIN